MKEREKENRIGSLIVEKRKGRNGEKGKTKCE